MVTKRRLKMSQILENIEKREQEEVHQTPDVEILLERLAEDIGDNILDII